MEVSRTLPGRGGDCSGTHCPREPEQRSRAVLPDAEGICPDEGLGGHVSATGGGSLAEREE